MLRYHLLNALQLIDGSYKIAFNKQSLLCVLVGIRWPSRGHGYDVLKPSFYSPVTQQIQIHFSLAWATFATQKTTLISGYFKSLEQSENSLDEAHWLKVCSHWPSTSLFCLNMGISVLWVSCDFFFFFSIFPMSIVFQWSCLQYVMQMSYLASEVTYAE